MSSVSLCSTILELEGKSDDSSEAVMCETHLNALSGSTDLFVNRAFAALLRLCGPLNTAVTTVLHIDAAVI